MCSTSSFTLQLYIAGVSEESFSLHQKAKEILTDKLDTKYTLEVIDIFQNTDRAYQSNVMATPTLVRVEPSPVKKIILDAGSEVKIKMAIDILINEDD